VLYSVRFFSNLPQTYGFLTRFHRRLFQLLDTVQFGKAALDKGGQVSRVPAGDKVAVLDHLEVHKFGAGILDVLDNGDITGDLAVPDGVGGDQLQDRSGH